MNRTLAIIEREMRKLRRLRGVPGPPDGATFAGWGGVRAARRNPERSRGILLRHLGVFA